MNGTLPKRMDIAISGVLNRSAHKGLQNFDDHRRFRPKDLVKQHRTSRDRDRVKLVDKQLGVIEKKHWTLEVTETERLISFGTRQWETPYTNTGSTLLGLKFTNGAEHLEIATTFKDYLTTAGRYLARTALYLVVSLTEGTA